MPSVTTRFSKTLLIIAMLITYAMIFIDESGIAVTLPTIQEQLALTSDQLHWVINSYLLVLTALLLLGGKLADLYGRRRIFLLGLVIFSVSSFLCALSHNAGMLLSGRCLQGVGASLLMPSITVLIQRGFSKEAFGKVYGLILGVGNFFYATGPFIGGVLTEYLSWHYFFWLNLPLGAVCYFFILAAVTKDSKAEIKHFQDFFGLCTFIIALVCLVLAVMQGASVGWTNPWILMAFATAALSLVVFIKHEIQCPHPLLELQLFKIRNFSAGNAILFCTTLCLSSILFWALWLQLSLSFSPAAVGIALLPATVTFIFIPTLAGRWYDKVGPRIPLFLGSSLILFATLWMVFMMPQQSYGVFFIGLLAFGIGIPLTIPVSIMTIMTAIHPEQSGMASGMFSTNRQLGLTLGIALLSAIVTNLKQKALLHVLNTHTAYKSLSHHQVNLLLAGKHLITTLPHNTLFALKKTAQIIYTHALASGMILISVFAALALIITITLVRQHD